MKIGILTVYFADYGSHYHAVALNRFINDLGYDAEIINECVRYKHSLRLLISSIFRRYAPTTISNMIKKIVPNYKIYLDLEKSIKNEKISEPFKDISEFSSKYDLIIVGSDELWSATNKLTRFIPAYFGLGLACPHISYSTSAITIGETDKEMTRKIKEGLRGFSSIAVRDEFTADWVKKMIGGERPNIVLDPALLYPVFTDTSQDACDERYIAVYGRDFSTEDVMKIKELSEKLKAKVVSAVWKHKWCEYYDVSSEKQLQQFIECSKFVVSSTLHGTIFAMQHKKDFISFRTKLRGNKIRDLLNQFNLQDRFVEDSTQYDINKLKPLDWDSIYLLLDEKREFSKQWLINSIEKASRNEAMW